MNERIRISPVRVIDEGGEQLGILPTAEALERARQAGLDLVEVSPTERPPVCKIMDYGKFKYNQKKKQRQQHKHSHETQIKEVRFRPKIDKNDREVKMKRARGFLEKGDKVQFTMLFRGRENAHRDIGRDIFSEIVEEFSEISKMEQFPKLAGRRMTMVLAPTKIKPPTAEKPKAAVKPKEASIPKEAAKPEEAAKPAEVSKPD